jgi:hypothetical protein
MPRPENSSTYTSYQTQLLRHDKAQRNACLACDAENTFHVHPAKHASVSRASHHDCDGGAQQHPLPRQLLHATEGMSKGQSSILCKLAVYVSLIVIVMVVNSSTQLSAS